MKQCYPNHHPKHQQGCSIHQYAHMLCNVCKGVLHVHMPFGTCACNHKCEKQQAALLDKACKMVRRMPSWPSHHKRIQSLCMYGTIPPCHQDAWNMWVDHPSRPNSSPQMTIEGHFALPPLACVCGPCVDGWHKLDNGVGNQAHALGKPLLQHQSLHL